MGEINFAFVLALTTLVVVAGLGLWQFRRVRRVQHEGDHSKLAEDRDRSPR